MKKLIQEIADSPESIKQSRSEPKNKPSGFIKSLINNDDDQIDTVTFDIPLLMRILELAREGINSDIDLHNLVERILKLKNKGVLTMNDYVTISNGNKSGYDMDTVTTNPIPSIETEDLLRLAGVKK